jgi:hypothetical protein
MTASDVENRLIEMYRRMHTCMVQGDTAALDALLAPGFRLVHMTGYDQPRIEWLSQIQSGRMRYFTSQEEAVTVEVAGGTAFLHGQNRVNADIWGARGTWPLQLDIDFVCHGGKWLMSHATASTY